MNIWVGLSTRDLTSLDHRELSLGVAVCNVSPSIYGFSREKAGKGELLLSVKERLTVVAHEGRLQVKGRKENLNTSVLYLYCESDTWQIFGLSRAGAQFPENPHYQGVLRLEARGRKLRVALGLDLETYLQGVLESEMPASYHSEALKCQALAARTYALRPRLSHEADGINVCDSYLCCQYFSGLNRKLDPRIALALKSTKGEILTYQDKPILALFSACAGGITENYEACFSDPLSGEFPPPAIAYLKGVKEGTAYPALGGEALIKFLFQRQKLNKNFAADAWNNKFSFSYHFCANDLESFVHTQIAKLCEAKESAPFIVAPPSGKFGYIEKLAITRRGPSATAMELVLKTSKGDWCVRKELLIRKVFHNPDLKIARLPSAKIILEPSYNKLGLLNTLVVKGVGTGHGVGFQQIGAQGHAKNGLKYEAILSHYFQGARLSRLD
jgi:stage II sporulation protein D